MAEAGFWNDRQEAERVSRQSRLLKDTLESWDTLKQQLQDLSELSEMAAEEEDEAALGELESELADIQGQVDDLEFRTMQ